MASLDGKTACSSAYNRALSSGGAHAIIVVDLNTAGGNVVHMARR
jgi:hypothetical protein